MECRAWILLGFLSGAYAAEIEGTVVIKRVLTKRKVTPSAGAYHRGAAVPLALDRARDLIAFERSRVVVYLEGDLGSQPAEAVMDQKDRRFLPDTLVVPAGSTVSFPNHDPIFHNVFSLSKPRTFDLGNYPRNQTRIVTFPKPGVVFVHCRLHPNMAAAIVVSPNQWSTRLDREGRFVLSGVPSGRHVVVAWHKAAGFFRQTVETGAGSPARVQFSIPVESNAHPNVAYR